MKPDPRAPIAPKPIHPDDLDEDDFQSLVGAWASPTPAEVRELIAGATFRWWLVGGWALELAGAPSRPHKDTDVAFALDDLPMLRAFVDVAGLDLWAPMPGGYRPVLPGSTVQQDEEQFWIRRDATSPWLIDLLATPCPGDTWVFKKDARIHRPMDDAVLVSSDGIPHLAPELVFLHQATQRDAPPERPDLVDDLLDASRRAWLEAALRAVAPIHSWLR